MKNMTKKNDNKENNKCVKNIIDKLLNRTGSPFQWAILIIRDTFLADFRRPHTLFCTPPFPRCDVTCHVLFERLLFLGW